MREADFAMNEFRREFNRTPVGRNWKYVAGQALPRNYEVMRAIDTGDLAALTPLERQFATVMRGLFDEAIDAVHAVSPNSLRDLMQNYFPRIWRDPEKHADAINRLMSRRPWEGPKSFLKKRVLEDFTEGLQMGLVPVSDNPVDVTLQKLGEMYRFATARRAQAEARAAGLRKFVYIYEQKPMGWRMVDEPSSSVFAPPTVTVKEAFDAQLRAKTIEFLRVMGVPHQRLAAIGGQRWGYATGGAQGHIVTKFAGPDFVIWHEMGHIMDWRFPELRTILPNTGQSSVAKELRALADLRYEGSNPTQTYKDNVRKHEEKLANVFDAYLRAPAKFQATAPNVWRVFNEWLDRTPAVKIPLNDIKPSLTLEEGSTKQFVGGPVLLGHWMMPDGAAQVLDNYLTPGLGKHKSFRTLREISGLQTGVQLAGFFHGGFVMNDSWYSGMGLSLYDVMQGKPLRALGELAQTPITPFTSLYRGNKIYKAIQNPGAADAAYKRLANLAVEQNLRAGHDIYAPRFSARWNHAIRELLSTPSIGAAWESMWRLPLALVQKAMYPCMELLVPRMKLGIYARMAERVMADNPNADEAELRQRLAGAADATENRLGQVTYDNMFQTRTWKDGAQLAFRAYGWQATKYRMIGGGTVDWGRWVKGGFKKGDVTFDMTYLPAMAVGHAILGGILQYALTGKPPQKLTDYLFPESGLIDAYGNPVRLAIADFMKDLVADVRSFPHHTVEEVGRKLAPYWGMAAEMYRNEDFWGTQIFSQRHSGDPELDHHMQNVREGLAYLAKATQPFSIQGGRRLVEAGGGPAAAVAPFFGVTPAPRYATQSPAEALSAEIMRGMMPKQAQTQEAATAGRARSQLIRDIRTGKVNSEGQFEERAKAAKVDPRDQRTLTLIRERVLWTPMQYQVHKMAVDDAMAVFDLANEQERTGLAPFLADKIQRAWDGGHLSPDKAKRYVALTTPYLHRKRAGQANGRSSGFSAFKPLAGNPNGGPFHKDGRLGRQRIVRQFRPAHRAGVQEGLLFHALGGRVSQVARPGGRGRIRRHRARVVSMEDQGPGRPVDFLGHFPCRFADGAVVARAPGLGHARSRGAGNLPVGNPRLAEAHRPAGPAGGAGDRIT